MKTIAKINNIEINIIDDAEKLVPIKPICEALGIDFSVQLKKIKDDDFLSSTVVLSTTVGGDGKKREMTSLPYKYIFGWLFTINPKNVKAEAKEAVLNYRMQCYDALYSYFTESTTFLEEKQEIIDKELYELSLIKSQFKTANERLYEQTKKVDEIRKMTIEEWKANKRQLKIDF